MNNVNSICPQGYIFVDANEEVDVSHDFCVMKYEAKCSGSACPSTVVDPNAKPVSTSQGAPWVWVSAVNALRICQSLGENYDLISNSEWMAIARSIEAEPSNWVGGQLNRGWASGPSDSFANTTNAPETGPNCLYNVGANTCGATGDHIYKRTHTLSNGEEIWDFSGNLYEWVDWEIEADNRDNFTPMPKCPSGANTEIQTQITSCAGESPNLGEPIPNISKKASPKDTSLNMSHNVGSIGVMNGGGTPGARRSGRWSTSSAGIYLLNYKESVHSGDGEGFRCVYRL